MGLVLLYRRGFYITPYVTCRNVMSRRIVMTPGHDDAWGDVTSDIRARRKPSDWRRERRIILRGDCSVTSCFRELGQRSDTVQTCL